MRMQDLLPKAAKLSAVLKERRETIVVAESSTGGLISAALLSVPGASAYFLGGAVVYTLKARRALLDIEEAAVSGMRGASESYAALMARSVRAQFKATWSIAETGATGHTGNRYGDPPGHTCIAVAGPVDRVITLETGLSDRVANMRLFAARALDLLGEALAAGGTARKEE
jgi:PncC family amidohydrolase